MQGENAQVIVATECALSAKLFDQGCLALPYAPLLVWPTTGVPIALLAFWRTESKGAWLSTLAAYAIVLPSAVKVADLGTVFRLGRLWGVEVLTAMQAFTNLAVLRAVRLYAFQSFIPGTAAFGRAIDFIDTPYKLFTTCRASVSCLFHGLIIRGFIGQRKSTYYAIAERRIREAQMRPRLEGV